MIEANKRVYNRSMDLYGVVEKIEGEIAFVKYEWPYDPALPASPVTIENLTDVAADPLERIYERWTL